MTEKTAPRFEPGDIVHVAADATRSHGGSSFGLEALQMRDAIVLDGPDTDGDYRVYPPDQPTRWCWVLPKFLTLVASTEQEPSAPSPKQIAAVEWLRAVTERGYGDISGHARVILDSLDPALTTPRLVLPTEPGSTIYGGAKQPRTMFRLSTTNGPRHWIDEHGTRYNDDEARDEMVEWEEQPPAPERPPITVDRLDWALERNGIPIGKDDPVLESILEDLVNGTDR